MEKRGAPKRMVCQSLRGSFEHERCADDSARARLYSDCGPASRDMELPGETCPRRRCVYLAVRSLRTVSFGTDCSYLCHCHPAHAILASAWRDLYQWYATSDLSMLPTARLPGWGFLRCISTCA